MAAVYHTVSIYPYPLTNLVVQCGWDNVGYDTETVVDCGDHYEVTDIADSAYVKISANGYNTLTLLAGTYNINIGNWYAWTTYVDTQGGRTVTWYTLSATPSTGDSVYQTPPYLDSIVTTSTIISGDIDTYKFSQNPYITSASASSITIGGSPK